jgi:hypothetical protein
LLLAISSQSDANSHFNLAKKSFEKSQAGARQLFSIILAPSTSAADVAQAGTG